MAVETEAVPGTAMAADMDPGTESHLIQAITGAIITGIIRTTRTIRTTRAIRIREMAESEMTIPMPVTNLAAKMYKTILSPQKRIQENSPKVLPESRLHQVKQEVLMAQGDHRSKAMTRNRQQMRTNRLQTRTSRQQILETEIHPVKRTDGR